MAEQQPKDHWTLVIAWSTMVVLSVSLYLLYRSSLLTLPEPKAISQENPSSTPKPASRTNSRSRPLLIHSTPPKVSAQALLKFTCRMQDGECRMFPAVAIQANGTKPLLMTLASFLSESEWSSFKEVNYQSTVDTVSTVLPQKPTWLGKFTLDNQPNLQSKPDLANDLACWQLVNHPADATLPLAAQLVAVETPVWVLSLPVEKSPKWLKGRVAGASVNVIYIQMLERFDSEKLVGTIVVNESGEIVGTCQGGDFALTGASSVGLLKKLNETIPTR